MTEMLTVQHDIQAAVTDVIRYLAAFTATGDMADMSHARAGIKYLYAADPVIGVPLWAVCEYLQRQDMEESA